MFRTLLFFTLSVASCLAGPEDCLPVTADDGPPPDHECQEWVNQHDEPYFITHRYNCSRFWVCEPNTGFPDYNICLFECAACAPWPTVTAQCPSHALFFDPNIQYPFGPVCNWPAVIDCTPHEHCPLPCQEPDDNDKCQPECCQDADCPFGKPICNGDGICQNGCRDNEECMNWDGMCPGCQWCDKPANEDIGQCKPGCLTDDQCSDPTPICDLSDHTCVAPPCELPCQMWQDGACQPECCQDADCPEGKPLCNGDGVCQIGCRENEDCMNWNGMCPGCQWCDKPANEDIGQCKPGCLTDDQCSDPTPICDLSDHTCVAPPCELPCQMWQDGACQPECCQDEDCPAGTPLCDSNGHCIDGCRTSSECDGFDTICHEPWMTGDDNCEYCDNSDSGDEIGSCKPGCDDNHDQCPSGYDCDGKHLCNSEGATLIKAIHLTTESCEACSLEEDAEGGAKVTIIGTRAECTTRGLDHSDERDYGAGNTADFVSKEDNFIMGECNNAVMLGGPQNTTITWMGQGSWTPKEVRYEVTGNYFYCCALPSPPPTFEQGVPHFLTCDDGGDCNFRK